MRHYDDELMIQFLNIMPIIILIIKSIKTISIQVKANNTQPFIYRTFINTRLMSTTSYNLRTNFSYQTKGLQKQSLSQTKSHNRNKDRDRGRGQLSSQIVFAFQENNTQQGQFSFNHLHEQQTQYQLKMLRNKNTDDFSLNKSNYKNKNSIYKMKSSNNENNDHCIQNYDKQQLFSKGTQKQHRKQVIQLIERQTEKYNCKNVNKIKIKNEEDRQEIYNNQAVYYNSSNSNQNESLIKNLNALEKDEIIQILMDQIKLKKISEKLQSIQVKPNKLDKKKDNDNNNNNNKDKDKDKDKYNSISMAQNSTSFLELNQKYNDLVFYFQQYIQNTNQAQDHFKKIIQDLRLQKCKLQQRQKQKQRQKNLNAIMLSKSKSNSKFKQCGCFNNNQSQSYKKNININSLTADKDNDKLLIQKLQNTIQNYITINNELTNKLDRTYLDNQNLKLQVEELRGKLYHQSNLNRKLRENQKENNLNKKLMLKENQHINDFCKMKSLKKFMSIDNAQIQNNYQKLQIQKNVLAEKNMNTNKTQQNLVVNHQENQEECKKSNVSSIRNNDSVQNCSSLSSQIREMNLENQSQSYLNTIRVLEVTNKQIKIINRKLQKIVQKKSQKIRKLLEDLQKTSQEKLQLKQQYMMLMCRLRQFQIINQKNLQRSNSSTAYHQNLTKQQKQDIKASTYNNYKISANVNPIKSFDIKTRQFDNMSLASRISTQGPISYSYASQKQFKLDNKKEMVNQLNKCFFDEHLGQQNINSQRNSFDQANINMKRKKQKQNTDFYEITKQNYKLS